MGTGAGVSALVHIFTVASPGFAVSSVAFAGVRSLRVDTLAVLALIGHAALINVLTVLPVLGDHLAVAAVAVAGVRAVTVDAATLPFTRVFIALIYIDTVCLQCAELEAVVTFAGVAGLHGDASPVAAYVRGGGTLVHIWGRTCVNGVLGVWSLVVDC